MGSEYICRLCLFQFDDTETGLVESYIFSDSVSRSKRDRTICTGCVNLEEE